METKNNCQTINLSLRGIPTPEIMERVDTVKKMIVKGKFWKLSEMNTICSSLLLDVTESAKEIGKMFPMRIRKIVTAILGYDLVYRLRIQDLFNETTQTSLMISPRGELKRLYALYLEREVIIPTYMQWKFKRLFDILLLGLYVPKFKRAFKKAIELGNWEKIKFTKEDLEWCKVRNDYKFLGRQNCIVCDLPLEMMGKHRECSSIYS